MHLPKRFHFIQKAISPHTTPSPPIDRAKIMTPVDYYFLTSAALGYYTAVIGSENIAKIVKELQAEDEYARMKGRHAERLEDVDRLMEYSKRHQNKEDEAKRIEYWGDESEENAVRLAQHRLQLDEQLMASILGVTKSSL